VTRFRELFYDSAGLRMWPFYTVMCVALFALFVAVGVAAAEGRLSGPQPAPTVFYPHRVPVAPDEAPAVRVRAPEPVEEPVEIPAER
jgi:hypothetical protein